MQRSYDSSVDNHSDDEEQIPLHHKRPFGSGLKRKRVEFVPAKDPDAGIKSTIEGSKTPATAIGDLYASVVLQDVPPASKAGEESPPKDAVDICPVCALPTTASSGPHETSLAHQVCLTHSHPPSALDRSRMGLRALEAQGWDPDARRGLGREGEGLRYPIKVAAKEDMLGVGARVPDSVLKKEKVEKPRKLNRKEMRQLAEMERIRNERLQGEIYGRVDVERYLRGDG
ncbi:hypothetical protein QQZ08_003570 [Neonectria magnoliae]|uniref:G-patch domain-containing protein n=1 Tax=Neonectria magnoliae TaxID=2732573 RepID=A0ABR1IAT5_9HYPO